MCLSGVALAVRTQYTMDVFDGALGSAVEPMHPGMATCTCLVWCAHVARTVCSSRWEVHLVTSLQTKHFSRKVEKSSLYKATPTALVRSHAPVFAPALGPSPDKIAHCATCTYPGDVPKPHTKAFTRLTRVTKSPIHREHREHRETERPRDRPPSPHVTG